jgi:hypothetical protein
MRQTLFRSKSRYSHFQILVIVSFDVLYFVGSSRRYPAVESEPEALKMSPQNVPPGPEQQQ